MNDSDPRLQTSVLVTERFRRNCEASVSKNVSKGVRKVLIWVVPVLCLIQL